MNLLSLKKLQSIIFSVLLLSLVAVAAVSAQGYDFTKDSGLQNAGDKAGYDVKTTTSIENVIGQAVLTGLSLVGIAFFGFLIYGGLTWMTARDNEEKVKKANAIILSSLIGFIVTLAAYVLTYFLLQYFMFSPSRDIQPDTSLINP